MCLSVWETSLNSAQTPTRASIHSACRKLAARCMSISLLFTAKVQIFADILGQWGNEGIGVKIHWNISKSTAKSKKLPLQSSRVTERGKREDVRISRTWTALHALHTIWTSNSSNNMKVTFFRETAESVLPNGSDTWTLRKALEKNNTKQNKNDPSKWHKY